MHILIDKKIRLTAGVFKGYKNKAIENTSKMKKFMEVH